MAIAAQFAHQVGNPMHCRRKGTHVSYLGADMHAHAGHPQMTYSASPGVEHSGLFNGHAELVLAKASRNVRMGIGGDIRGHSQCNRSAATLPAGALRPPPKFAFAFYGEEENTCLLRPPHFFLCFSNTPKCRPPG